MLLLVLTDVHAAPLGVCLLGGYIPPMDDFFKLVAWATATFALGLAQASANPIAITCEYPKSASATLTAKTEKSSPTIAMELHQDSEFKLSFVVEPGESTAFLHANQGAAKVHVVWGADKITFIEVTGNSTVQVTTLFGKTLGSNPSVHSRATGIGSVGVPSQYYGHCLVK